MTDPLDEEYVYDPETAWLPRECMEGTCNPDWKPPRPSGMMPEAAISFVIGEWPPENFKRLRTICGRCNYYYLLPDSAVAAFDDGWMDPTGDPWIRNFAQVLLPARERVATGEGKPGGPGLLSKEEYEALKA